MILWLDILGGFPLKCYKLHQHIFLISLLSWPPSTEEKTGRKGHAVFISLFKTCHINFHFIPLVHLGGKRLLRDSGIPNPLLWGKLQLVFIPFICTLTLILNQRLTQKEKWRVNWKKEYKPNWKAAKCFNFIMSLFNACRWLPLW